MHDRSIARRFEYTFELGWKTFKDYLAFCGVLLDEATPRKVIKECAASGIFAELEKEYMFFMAKELDENG